MTAKVMLIIMDGWGIGQVPASDAIRAAHTPFVDGLYKTVPHTTLITCGEAVGLPANQMGNSEVGHLNLGAGRIVYQELERINVAIRDKSFHSNPALLEAVKKVKDSGSTLHLLGLLSDGGVHSHINHLKAILSVCSMHECNNVVVHAFTDGRDTDPKSAHSYLNDLLKHMESTTGSVATITGRYFAMDRDKRWERIKVAYDALVHATGTPTDDLPKAILNNYEEGITDEFIKPLINNKVKNGTIKNGDVAICFNFRTDRCREITEVLTQTAYPEAGMHPLAIAYYTMTIYDPNYKNITAFFEKDNLNNTLGEVLSKHGKTQLRIAETEKYPHVSFFFSGGRETPFEGEKRRMIPSPKVATYNLKPEMSAYELTNAVLEEMNNHYDFICLNFANADMVGHTGVWDAVVKAVETVDSCVEKVVKSAAENDYTIFLTADHGNADYEKNEDGSPNTAHTLNPVPFFIINKHFNRKIKPGKLGDVAPTILQLMHLPVPSEMTGENLIV